ncbi:MAG: TIGR02453 family protein, partial [Pseudomonadota bacterium]
MPFSFSPSLLTFLRSLRRHNEREWFAANKARYERDVREPALDFIEAMAEPLEAISPHFVAMPKKTGGSLMRPYRDTRFSKDKTPYKTNVGIQFRHALARDVHAPGFYFHIDPDEVFIGVGTWRPEPKALAAIRERIVDRPDEWRKVGRSRLFTRHFELAGEFEVACKQATAPDLAPLVR